MNKTKRLTLYLINFLIQLICLSRSLAELDNKKSGDIRIKDLKQAVEMAIELSPEVDSILKAARISELKEKNAFAEFLPSLDLTATHGYRDYTSQSSWYSDFKLSMTENLYDNGVSLTNYKVAGLLKKQAELEKQFKINKICFEIAYKYLEYSLKKKVYDIQEKQHELFNKQYNSVSNDFHNGMKTKRDYLRFKTQLSRSEILLLNAKNDIERIKLELINLIGVKTFSQEKINIEPLKIDDYSDLVSNANLQFNIEEHYYFKKSKIIKEINGEKINLTNRKLLPEWNLSAGINYTSSNYFKTGQSFADNDELGWDTFLTVKFNFLDWGTRSRNTDIANYEYKIQENVVSSELLGITTELESLKINYSEEQQNLKMTKSLFNLEKDNFDLIQRDYFNGKIQYLDLITGMNYLTDAEIKYYSTVTSLLQLNFKILHNQGRLYDVIRQ